MLDIALIAAIAENDAFGHKGAMPWRLKGELAIFKRITMGHAVIMGRKTYDSLPFKPLTGRGNIIISRQEPYDDQAVFCQSFEESLQEAQVWDQQQTEPKGVAMVIGGAEILRLALPKASIFYRTLVHSQPEADVFFNGFDTTQWQATETLAETPEYTMKKWIRK